MMNWYSHTMELRSSSTIKLKRAGNNLDSHI
jgi:hypothetical protein